MTADFQTAIAIGVQAGVPCLGEGLPGVAKTDFGKALGAALGAHVEVVIASHFEPTDITGIPTPVPGEGSLPRIHLAPPDWAWTVYEASKTRKVVLIFDEISLARVETQNALLQTFFGRKVGNLQLNDNVLMALFSNPPETTNGAWELTSTTANRLAQFTWEHTKLYGDWLDGMVQGFRPPDVPVLPPNWEHHILPMQSLLASFLRHKTDSIVAFPQNPKDRAKPWPSFRSWTLGARLLAAAKSVGYDPLSLIGKTLLGATVGSAATIEWATWMQHQDIPDIEELLARPDSWKRVPDRSDLLQVIADQIASAIIGYKGGDHITQDRYNAAWRLYGRMIGAGHKDVVVISGGILASNKPQNLKTPPELADIFDFLVASKRCKPSARV